MTDIQESALKNIRARMGEMFSDYVVIAKTGKNQIIMSCSDDTWTMGAAKRIQILLEQNDKEKE